MNEFITVCPRNCYSTCSFRVQVENNIIRRIIPYAENLATPEGPCIKGLSYIERSQSGKRLQHPLLKTAKGLWNQIPIDEALKIAAEKLSGITAKYGSQSIFWYRGSGRSGLINETGSSFWKYFGGVTTTYGNLCWPAGLEAVRLTLGTVMHNVPWDIENARTVIIWGKNPAETNIHEMAFIEKARAAGSLIIVIDPRQTPTADKADILFMPKPGTDAALALSVAWVLVEESLTDSNFIENNVLGFEEFRSRSLIDPETAEKICGIPASEIRRLAEIIGKGGPVTFIPGYGLQRYTNGGQTIRAILSLAVITGNLGKKGAGFNYANLQSCIFDEIREPLSYYPDPSQDKPFRRIISMAKLGEHMLAAREPEIKAIWVERGNPVLQSPDSSNILKAFSKSEFTVVVEQFMTDTAREADLVLPAIDIFEQSDIISSYWSPYVQFKPKILETEGESLPESEIYYHLAKLMGLDIPEDMLPPPGNEYTERWLEKRIKGYSDIGLDELRKGPVLAPGLKIIAYEDLRFDTPSGKIELYSKRIRELWDSSPYPMYNPIDDHADETRYPLLFISPNTSSRIHSQFGNLDVIRINTDAPAAEISVSDAEERGVMTGDTIRLFNDRGSVTSTAKITGRLKPGLVVLHNGIWRDEGGGSNFLTAPEETDIGHGAAFHGKRIEVEKVEEL
ncbi:MAG: molybdopterin-dependent oxidoreductase [Bacteroidales bacterium]|jgi:anaerobic selenocysteine-containing dehydrogenase